MWLRYHTLFFGRSLLHFFASSCLHFVTSSLLQFSISWFPHFFTFSSLHFLTSHFFTSIKLHFFTSSLLHFLPSSLIHFFTSSLLRFLIAAPLHFPSASLPQFFTSSLPHFFISQCFTSSLLHVLPTSLLHFLASSLVISRFLHAPISSHPYVVTPQSAQIYYCWWKEFCTSSSSLFNETAATNPCNPRYQCWLCQRGGAEYPSYWYTPFSPSKPINVKIGVQGDFQNHEKVVQNIFHQPSQI